MSVEIGEIKEAFVVDDFELAIVNIEGRDDDSHLLLTVGDRSYIFSHAHVSVLIATISDLYHERHERLIALAAEEQAATVEPVPPPLDRDTALRVLRDLADPGLNMAH